MKRSWICGGAIGLLAVMLCLCWLWHRYAGSQVEAVKQLQADLFSEEARKLPSEQRREQFTEYRDRIKSLSDSQRKKLSAYMWQGRQAKMQAELTDFFSLSRKQQAAHLDKEIDASEKRRKERSSRMKVNGPGSGRERGRGRGGEITRKERSPEQRAEMRDRFRRSILDRTTPEYRAQMSAYREALRKRREARGLPDRRSRG